jgi:hypothetical protein
MYALTSRAGKQSIDDLMAWCRGRGNVSPSADSGTTTASSSEEALSPPIGEASRDCARGTSARPPDGTDGTFDEVPEKADVSPSEALSAGRCTARLRALQSASLARYKN